MKATIVETPLDRLLASIDPERTLEQTATRANDALNTFVLRSGVLTDWRDFKQCLCQFYCDAQGKILDLRQRRETNLWLDWGRCHQLLVAEYGPNGEKTAYDMARLGLAGGVYAILRVIARRLAEEHARTEITARVAAFWNSLSAQELVAAADEYVEKYRHILPPELTAGNGGAIKVYFVKVLQEHPGLIQQLRRVGR